jgi:hypothetical protein
MRSASAAGCGTRVTGLDPITRRQLVLLDHEYTGNALDEETIEELTARETELQRIFTNFRAELDGETLSDNQLREILRTERDQDRRRRAWEASKQIAPEVADRLLALVRRRNEAARSLGFPDFYRMALTLQEHDEETLFGILDEFERAPRRPSQRSGAASTTGWRSGTASRPTRCAPGTGRTSSGRRRPPWAMSSWTPTSRGWTRRRLQRTSSPGSGYRWRG